MRLPSAHRAFTLLLAINGLQAWQRKRSGGAMA